MNKPVATGTARIEIPAPAALSPKIAAPARSPLRKILAVAAGFALLVAAAIAWWTLGTTSPVHYTTAPVTRGAITRGVTATGTVNPELTIIVGSYVSGVIQEIYCDYNTQVKKGQVCAQIDPRPYQSVVDQNKANLAMAKAQLVKDQANFDYAQINYDRNVRLSQTNAISKDTLDIARNALDQARAQIGVDQATIAAAPGPTRGGASQSRLHQHRLAGGRHRGVAQRDHGADGGGEFPDADSCS